MAFKVSLLEVPGDNTPVKKGKGKVVKGPPKAPVERKTPSWEAEGIKVSKYMRHPTCIFCGLPDLGKEAAERPTAKHMLSCRERKLSPKPFTELNGVRSERVGAFVGEAPAISLRIPLRLIRRVEVATGEKIVRVATDWEYSGATESAEVEVKDARFLCSYKWKVVPAFDWVWAGAKGWEEWYKWWSWDSVVEAPVLNLGPDATEEQQVRAARWVEYFKTK